MLSVPDIPGTYVFRLSYFLLSYFLLLSFSFLLSSTLLLLPLFPLSALLLSYTHSLLLPLLLPRLSFSLSDVRLHPQSPRLLVRQQPIGAYIK